MRNARRVWVRYVVLWALVVAATSALAWLAIGRSGRELAAIDALPSATPGATTASTGSDTPPPSASTTPTRPNAPTSGPPPATATSLTTRGGRVTVTCRGSLLTFRSATPADGWSVDGPLMEDGRLELKFVAADAEIEISGRCANGVPVVTQQSD
ncbi:MAG: hypothetical protein U0Q21_01055 [Dermatophilaceae bacterium]